MERAVSPNRQQVGTRVKPPVNASDPIGSSLEVHTVTRRNELTILPALKEDTENPHNAGNLNELNNQDANLRLAEVDLAAGNGGEAAPNDQLQHMEQVVLQAVRRILGLPIVSNVITGKHCWLVLNQLSDNLPKEGAHGMPYAQEYARFLEWMARVMTIPSEHDYESAHGAHRALPLDYEDLVKVVEKMTPDFRYSLDYGECLDRLRKNLTATASVMRVGDGVIYVIKDREDYARLLRCLAAHVLRCA